jgi:hypothetical protein
MTARGPRLILSAVVAVATTLPLFRIAGSVDSAAGIHSSRHRPARAHRVAPVAEIRDAQASMARYSAMKDISRRSRTMQPLLVSAACRSRGGRTVSCLAFPLRC